MRTPDGRLRLCRVAGRRSTPRGAFRPELVGFLADVAELYSVDGPAIGAGTPRSTYAEMVEEFLDEPWAGEQPYDFAVVAHAWSDSEPGWPGTVLTTRLPGAPPACGISDQGVTSAFAAIRVLDAYARTGAVRRAAVMVLDQSTHLVDRSAVAGRVPAADGAAALVFSPDGGLGDLSVQRVGGIAPAAAARAVDDLVHVAVPDVLIVGPTLAERWVAPNGLPVVAAPADLPCVGPWLALAAIADRWGRRHRRIGLVDYEPGAKELGLITVDLSEPGVAP